MNIILEEDFDEALNNLSRDFGYLNASKDKGYNPYNHLSDKLSQRDKERRLRETLQSSHGPTAEIHDQVKKS